MAITSLHCPPPIRRATKPPRADHEVLDAAVELFGQKRYEDALKKVFAYLFPGRRVPNVAKKAFTFPQGSSRVTVRLEDDELTIRVPVVRLGPGSNATAALRFLLTKEAGAGQLYQPRLRGEDVTFEFTDRLHRLHPHKVVEVLRKMPVEADNHDDWMVGEFGVTLLDRQPIPPLDAAELERADALWRAHWGDVQELLKEAQRRRSLFFLNEVTCYAIYHARCSLPVTGLYGARLVESASTFNDTNIDPIKRETTLARCAKDMLAASREDLAQSLGFAELSISPLAEGTLEVLGRYLGSGDYAESVAGVRSSGRYIEAAVALVATFCYLVARYAWPKSVEAQLLEGIEAASGRPWREVAADLTQRGTAILNGWPKPDDAAETPPPPRKPAAKKRAKS